MYKEMKRQVFACNGSGRVAPFNGHGSSHKFFVPVKGMELGGLGKVKVYVLEHDAMSGNRLVGKSRKKVGGKEVVFAQVSRDAAVAMAKKAMPPEGPVKTVPAGQEWFAELPV